MGCTFQCRGSRQTLSCPENRYKNPRPAYPTPRTYLLTYPTKLYLPIYLPTLQSTYPTNPTNHTLRTLPTYIYLPYQLTYPIILILLTLQTYLPTLPLHWPTNLPYIPSFQRPTLSPRDSALWLSVLVWVPGVT